MLKKFLFDKKKKAHPTVGDTPSFRLHYRFCYTEGVNNSFLESSWNSWAFEDLDYAQKALQSYFSSQVWERFPVLSVVLLQQTNAAFCQSSVAVSFFFFFFCETSFCNHLSAITFHFLNCPLNIRIGLGSVLHKLPSLQVHKKTPVDLSSEAPRMPFHILLNAVSHRIHDSTLSSVFHMKGAADRWSNYAWEQQGSNNLSVGRQPDPVRCVFRLFDLSPVGTGRKRPRLQTSRRLSSWRRSQRIPFCGVHCEEEHPSTARGTRLFISCQRIIVPQRDTL